MKMPPRTNLPIQIIARRRFSGLDCIIGWRRLLGELVQEIAKDFVAHYAGVGKCLAFGVNTLVGVWLTL